MCVSGCPRSIVRACLLCVQGAGVAPSDLEHGRNSNGSTSSTRSPWAWEFLGRVIPALQVELGHERLLARTRQSEARVALQELGRLLSPGEFDDADGGGGGGGGGGGDGDAGSPDGGGAASLPVSSLVRSVSLSQRGGGGRVHVELKLDLNTPLRAANAAKGVAPGVAASAGGAGNGGDGGGRRDDDKDDDDDAATLDDLITRRVQAAMRQPLALDALVVVDYLRTAWVRSGERGREGVGEEEDDEEKLGGHKQQQYQQRAVEVEYCDDRTREVVSLDRLVPYSDTEVVEEEEQ
jgi:hypothetical protein